MKSGYKKTKGVRNIILFAKNLTGHREKFTGKKFAQKWPGFLCFFVVVVMPFCLKSGIIEKTLYIRIHNMN